MTVSPMLFAPRSRAATGTPLACSCRSCRPNRGQDTRRARRAQRRREAHLLRAGRP